MVFKDAAGTVMAQRELAKQEKQVLQTLQNMTMNQNKNNGSAKTPYKVQVQPEPIVQMLPMLYKPQDMHCLKKLLEQEYDEDYVPPKLQNAHGKPFNPQDMHCLKKLLEQYDEDNVVPKHPYMTSTFEDALSSIPKKMQNLMKKKEKLEQAILNLEDGELSYKLLSEINEDFEESDDDMGTLEDMLNLNASYPG